MGFSSSNQQASNASQSNSASLNQAYPSLESSIGSQTGLVGQSTNVIANLLGLNGTSAQNTGFNNYLNSSGYNFVDSQGIQGINSNNASKGLLDSGSALKGIDTYNNGLATSYLNNYMTSLTGLSNTGLQAAQVLSGAGNTANSQSTSSGTSSGSSTAVKTS